MCVCVYHCTDGRAARAAHSNAHNTFPHVRSRSPGVRAHNIVQVRYPQPHINPSDK